MNLSIDEMAIILSCLEQITIGDMLAKQKALQKRLARRLQEMAPEQYKALVSLRKITDWEAQRLERVTSHKGVRVSDWMKFNCGDRVFRADDPRHVGRVESITNGACVKVRWDDNRICSHIPLADALNKKYCGRLIKVKQLLCGCLTDGSVICMSHKD